MYLLIGIYIIHIVIKIIDPLLPQHLANYLSNRGPDSLRGKQVLELGSGTGFVGLVAAMLGATVYITDQR
jgi:predicted RNA methylase